MNELFGHLPRYSLAEEQTFTAQWALEEERNYTSVPFAIPKHEPPPLYNRPVKIEKVATSKNTDPRRGWFNNPVRRDALHSSVQSDRRAINELIEHSLKIQKAAPATECVTETDYHEVILNNDIGLLKLHNEARAERGIK